jgi:hypothetical protein
MMLYESLALQTNLISPRTKGIYEFISNYKRNNMFNLELF